MRIGIVAPASPVGQIELANGVARLRQHGLDVVVHPQTAQQHFLFAGTDRQRAQAFFDFASDASIDAIWCAGGGYGATRILPLLEEMTEDRRLPARKLLVGYSDITALHEFVRSRWNWASLHFPMPAAPSFTQIDAAHFDAAISYLHGRKPADPWTTPALRFLYNPPAAPVSGVVVGGNLSLWAAMAGTPYAPIPVPGRIIFLEDVDEAPYRIDRMIVQLLQERTLLGASAIVLGDFTGCDDSPSSVMATADDPSKRMPLRPTIPLDRALAETFALVSEKLGIPIAVGLPVGHGPNFSPLPLGAEYELSPQGVLSLTRWSWLQR